MAHTVLVAEDEPPMSHALQLKLEKEGFAVKTAADGDEALEILTKDRIDLLLLDLMMPKRDGFSVLQGIRDAGLTLPVIVSSNLSQQEDAEKCKALGARDYFVKSNTPIASVVSMVKKYLPSTV